MNNLFKKSLYVFGILILVSFIFAYIDSVYFTKNTLNILLALSIVTFIVMPSAIIIIILFFDDNKNIETQDYATYTTTPKKSPIYYAKHHTLGQTPRSRSINHEYSSQRKRRVTPKMKVLVLERDNYTCQMCGKTVKDGVKLEVDHIHPFSKGGSDDISNLRTLCQECNRGKYDMVLPNYKKL